MYWFQSEILIYGSKVSEHEQNLKSVEHDLQQKSEQVELLQQTVRRNQDEIRSRNQEIEDLNIAVKERQWELQQRTQQVNKRKINSCSCRVHRVSGIPQKRPVFEVSNPPTVGPHVPLPALVELEHCNQP